MTLCYQWRLHIAVLLLAVPGCLDPHYPNHEFIPTQDKPTYRFDQLKPGEGNSDDVFICLTFSGGGTRAASLAYGVLKELQATPMLDGVPDHDLLDEVDMVSAVSGGAFPALGLGLWGEHVLDGPFEKRFLKRNVQRELLLNLWKPKYFWRLSSVLVDRIDVAGYYYDQEVFQEGTYADLIKKGTRPFIVVNATNVALGDRFAFTQDDFDLLGSDLAALRVAWAAAASSAFPILLSPLRFKYFPNEIASGAIARLVDGDGERLHPRRHRWARSLMPREAGGEEPRREVDADNHRFLYLLDGGLSDNLGLSAVIESYRTGFIRQRIECGDIKKLVVIVVDAATEPPEHIEAKKSAPGLLKVGLKTGTTGMERHSATLTGIARFVLIDEAQRKRSAHELARAALDHLCPDAVDLLRLPEDAMESYLVEVNFRDIPDEQERRTFLSMLTSFFLPSRDVDNLIDMGGRLLREDEQFQSFVRSLGVEK